MGMGNPFDVEVATNAVDSVGSSDAFNLIAAYGIGVVIGIVIGLLIWIGCIVACILIMKRKGRSAGLGFVFGFFLGWIGLIIVLCKKPVNNNKGYNYKPNY